MGHSIILQVPWSLLLFDSDDEDDGISASDDSKLVVTRLNGVLMVVPTFAVGVRIGETQGTNMLSCEECEA